MYDGFSGEATETPDRHPFVIFRPKRSWGNKGVPNQFIPVLQSICLLAEVDQCSEGGLEEEGYPRSQFPGIVRIFLTAVVSMTLAKRGRRECSTKTFWYGTISSYRFVGERGKKISAQYNNVGGGRPC